MASNIILIGFMGSGKTTVGKLLARRLSWGFIDTDEMIVHRAGKPVERIFKEDGETRFRELERGVIEEVSRLSQRVIATGGGAVLDPANRERLKESGKLFLLAASPDVIYERVKDDSSRPLLSTSEDEMRARIEALLQRRKGEYLLAADYVIDTDLLTPNEVADVILQLFRGDR